ncbi:uncharacterized protein LOC124230738 [Equus quagga]|uniref:uncharacterized protein LOC124230738 n=1 Tax=Equus quagga TaxID=89248 RepID=UPI001EE15AC1|nr:uncharacterized protein LOC124230738 [Equus quagga]
MELSKGPLRAPTPRRQDASPERGRTRSAQGETRAGTRAGGATTAESPGREPPSGQSRTQESPGWTRGAAARRSGRSVLTFPLCALGALAKPGTPGFLGIRLRSPAHRPGPRPSDNPSFPGGERKDAPGHENRVRLFRRTQRPSNRRTNFACAATPGRLSLLLAGCGLPSQGVRGAVRPGPRRSHPWAPRVHYAACAPSGRPTGTAGQAALAACSFRTRAARPISLPCQDHIWSPVWKLKY